MRFIVFVFIIWSQFLVASPGWKVDCMNHCFFSDMPKNCQGVFWQYEDVQSDGTIKATRSYSSWSDNYNACEEVNLLEINTHIIYPNQIQCHCAPPAQTPPLNRSAPLTAATRASLELLRAQIHAWTMCNPEPSQHTNYTNVYEALNHKDLRICQEARKNNQGHTFGAPSSCMYGLWPWGKGCNFPGNPLVHTAMSCLLGETKRCTEIKAAQDPVTGAVYRGEFKRITGVHKNEPTFSRDEVIGILAYVTKTKDKVFLMKWLNFIKNNTPRIQPGNSLSICPPLPSVRPPGIADQEWENMIPDDRCVITIDLWGQIYFVAIHAGILISELNTLGSEIVDKMIQGSLVVDTTLKISAATSPALGPEGFQIALLFYSTYIRGLNGGAGNSRIIAAANLINQRTSFLNPSYHFLASNKQPTEYGAYLIRKYCTAPKPNYGYRYLNGYNGDGSNPTGYFANGTSLEHGAYQFAGGLNSYGHALYPNGHDCLLWLSMYLGNNQKKELRCDVGDTLINGACRVVSFNKPDLAWINGIGYQFRKDWRNQAFIEYFAFDEDQCPYGGTFNFDGVYRKCEFFNTFNVNSLYQNNVNYVVDPTPTNPRIYYPSLKGGCTKGGFFENFKCVIYQFNKATLYPDIRYWVDTNPSWPGVYYQKINGTCPRGGSGAGANCQIFSMPQNKIVSGRSYFTRSNPSHPGIYYYPQIVNEPIPFLRPNK